MRVICFMLSLLLACGAPYDQETAQVISTRKDAPVLFSRDTQRIARRRDATWLSIEPLLCWARTPLTLRLSDTHALSREQAENYSRDILHSMLWAANAHSTTRSFANEALGRNKDRPIHWDDLALKVTFWDSEGDRYPNPYIAQLVVHHGQLTTWLADPSTMKIVDPITRPLPPPPPEEPAADSGKEAPANGSGNFSK
ncbi:MAG: hypothetical protein ACOYKZ_01810 [Chlamydiia bacterium]